VLLQICIDKATNYSRSCNTDVAYLRRQYVVAATKNTSR